jgi:TatD DNase family protein
MVGKVEVNSLSTLRERKIRAAEAALIDCAGFSNPKAAAPSVVPVTLNRDGVHALRLHREAPLLIDSHAHLDSPRYAGDREAMLGRAWDAGVRTILSIGIGEGPTEMHQALDICREFNGRPNLPRIYASAGIYPHSTTGADETALAKLDALLAMPGVIACGEIGFDYYHEGAPRDVQRKVLIRQLEIAAARKRPILIHCRGTNESADAWDSLFVVLEEHWLSSGLGGIMHCFGGGWEQARRSLELGFLLSFAGNLTYPNAQALRDVAARVPMDAILVETDAPWLAPAPYRGQRNEPAFVAQTAQTLAQLQNVPGDEIAAATTENFFRLFPVQQNMGN